MELAFPSGPGPSTFAGNTREVLDWEDGLVFSEDHSWIWFGPPDDAPVCFQVNLTFLGSDLSEEGSSMSLLTWTQMVLMLPLTYVLVDCPPGPVHTQ